MHARAALRGANVSDIRQAVTAALAGRNVGNISVAVVDDATIADVNERFLGKARPTDVISFDLRDDPTSGTIEGEIVVSAETARRVAADLGLALREELLRYVIHGALHLAGWDDRTTAQRARMRLAENRTLAALKGKPASKRAGRGRAFRRQG
ncbi:MAG TPA: rRNA maturation RNase YbeY [Phycisphaerae bacterium]|nr:rRNA maturation RNase YbeY [Phycisphaerae bacterium]